MLIRAIRSEEKELYNLAVSHPLQSWEWGEFRKKTGVKVERLGFFEGEKITKGLQTTFHSLPFPGINKQIGYLPKGFTPDENQIAALKQLAQQHNALFIKLEPNLLHNAQTPHSFSQLNKTLRDNGAVPGRPLFTKYTFQLDLTQPEDALFANLSSKTRYNVNLAYKKGVKIFENSTKEGVEQYIEILEETMTRQGFYAHTPDYFRKMWQTMGDSGMLKVFNAVYQDQILVSWIMFVFNNILYYPYGASRNAHRDVMASNLMMWEMIRFGKEEGCHTFDMWGSLGPNPDEKNPWYGFHRFKKGYGGQLLESIGSYDLVMNLPVYRLYRMGEELRWKWLRLKTHLPF
ncbi:peptidoglycan bridge formation glycyltransferase FemA/FemB family protein [Patescibacteria group bacterium]|nr:peptidoglycan bridge formation glycyltransferase FemA/FemB family protein [Patescibacteria group bacterium]MBU1967333.1 peptidoglycan bridge formation glycyltransferase FemA/FemB family protein [Patescibacteria group bacterium]MBU2543186.1 peptidoglycan bridge formation glycyltransferase FemA/FemB family protein [Patescibacteria group bacterium]